MIHCFFYVALFLAMTLAFAHVPLISLPHGEMWHSIPLAMAFAHWGTFALLEKPLSQPMLNVNSMALSTSSPAIPAIVNTFFSTFLAFTLIRQRETAVS